MSEHSNNLRSIAQNDYMIDQHFLPDGVVLNEAADYIEKLEAENKRLREMLAEVASSSTHPDREGPGCWWCAGDHPDGHEKGCRYWESNGR